MLNPMIYADGGMPSFEGSRAMANNWINPSADEIEQRRALALRLKTAIDAARVRCRRPRLSAVMTNDGIIICDFYGLDGARKFSKMLWISAQFDYDEYEEAIQHVEAM